MDTVDNDGCAPPHTSAGVHDAPLPRAPTTAQALRRGLFRVFRAAYRWLIVDSTGRDYFKPYFWPRDTGDRVPGWQIPFYLAAFVICTPLWGPLLTGELSAEQRRRFVRWLDVDKDNT